MTTVPATGLPEQADLVVVGGGTAGAAVAGLVAELTDARVVLLEAGPDYGPLEDGRWPDDLLDAATLAMVSHDWGYKGMVNGREVDFNRARVIGGCSSHNGGAAVKGARWDYDGWAALGNPGWTTDELLPLFDSAWERFRVRPVGREDLTPFQAECQNAMAADGIPPVEDFNNLDETVGSAPFPVNIDEAGRRINSAFAYLDPVRDKGNLTVVGDATGERLVIEDASVRGIVFRHSGQERTIWAPRVVLCAGAYGSPAVLMRSGIGPAEVLAAAGIEQIKELAVGRNLHDQPTIEFDYTGTTELQALMEQFVEERGWRPDEQVIGKYPSSLCETGFDMHIFPLGGRDPYDMSSWRWTIAAACITPESIGEFSITGPRAGDPVNIDHGFLTDPDGKDHARLAEAAARIRRQAAREPLASLLGEEISPGPGVAGPDALSEWVSSQALHYWHPVGTCKMGPAGDDGAVVDAEGHLYGIEGAYVADASIMPSVMSGNTNMPTAVIGERMARMLAGRL